MGRTAKSRGVGKTRKDRNTSDHVLVSKKAVRKTEEPEHQILDIDFTRNTWSVKVAARWAGVPERTLYRMLRENIVPCIAMGESQVQKLSTAKLGKRMRKCYRFVIPRVAFMRAWENLGTVGNTAA
jgi:hypothetical protein